MLIKSVSSPCKDCLVRRPGCHSTCEDYFSYKEKLEEVKKVMMAEQANEKQEILSRIRRRNAR